MDRNILHGQWTQLKGKLKKNWGKLTDDDMDVIEGDYEILVGKLEEHYGRSREELEREVDDWLDIHMLTPEEAKPEGLGTASGGKPGGGMPTKRFN